MRFRAGCKKQKAKGKKKRDSVVQLPQSERVYENNSWAVVREWGE